jgi:demethylmenaquinone methyltransferase/2-methoxy-6-polyprenyl-1,4-benzoquinol methylase
MMPVMVGGPPRDPDTVRAMFDRIAARYDAGNRLMTLGLDQSWRRRAARVALEERRGAAALDCACGTGRLCSALVRAGATRVVGVDFSSRMIDVARDRHPSVSFVVADLMRLPFGDAEFDAVTIGFGLRNLPAPSAALREMGRVLRPAGRLVVLEAVRGEGPLKSALDLAARLGPAIAGRAVGDAAAYGYLSETLRTYATAADMVAWLTAAGFAHVAVERLGFGAVALVYGTCRPSVG